jgi:hypothetical protein
MAIAKTIQIFLPDGNPRGVRIADITSRTVQLIEIPRAVFATASKRRELNNVGVYFLFGSDESTGKRQVYVGEAENCLARLRQHDGARGKDFWKTAVVAISKTQYFTKAHAKYLEWYCYEKIQAADRFTLTNSAAPSRPHLPESVAADLEDNFESMRSLVSTLGFPIFEELGTRDPDTTLSLNGKNAAARGSWTEDGLVVLKSSLANGNVTKSAEDTWVARLRSRLVDDNILVREGDQLRFSTNFVFDSPSAAAGVVLGRSANGWTQWKLADGRALDALRSDNKQDSNDG